MIALRLIIIAPFWAWDEICAWASGDQEPEEE